MSARHDQIANITHPPTQAYLTTYLNGLPTSFLLDSGSPFTFLSSRVYYKIPKKFRPPLQKTTMEVNMADGQASLQIVGEAHMPVRIHDSQFSFKRFQCDLRFSTSDFVFDGKKYPLNTCMHDIHHVYTRLLMTTQLRMPWRI